MAVEAHATAKYIRTSAQKAGLVLDLIRGRDVNHPGDQGSPQGVARRHEKVLDPRRNAPTKDGFGDDVAVHRRRASRTGPSQKRIARPRRAFRVVKRTAHLTVRVARAAEVSRHRGEDKRRGARRQGEGEGAEQGGRGPLAADKKEAKANGAKVHPTDSGSASTRQAVALVADKDYAKLLHEDIKCATAETRFMHAGVRRSRSSAPQQAKHRIYTSRPGIIIAARHGSRQAEDRDPEETNRGSFHPPEIQSGAGRAA